MSFGQRDYDRTKPEIDFPGETPPTELVVEDLIEGSGPAVEAERAICRKMKIGFLNLPMPGDGRGQEPQFREVIAALDALEASDA